MKKLKVLKSKKGITLVALIITIILLIILAGVALSIALGENGIFTKSKNAVDMYKDPEAIDPNSLAANVKVGDYVSYDPTTGVDAKDLTYTSKRGSYVAKNADGGYIIGEGAEFANRDDFTSYSKYDSEGFLYKKAYELIDRNGKVTAGSGEQGSGSTYIIYGQTPTDQTFTAKSELKWRVLSIEDGVVNLVSEDVINEDVENDAYDLYGITGYNYGIAELNNICKIYGHGTGAITARSINVEDVNKLTGYKPENYSRYTETYGKEAGWGEKAKWINTYDYYDVDPSSNGSVYYWEVKDSNALNVLFKNGAGDWIDGYWLASRLVCSDSTNADFSMRCVVDSRVARGGLFYCDSSGRELRLSRLEFGSPRSFSKVYSQKSKWNWNKCRPIYIHSSRMSRA